MTNDRQRLIHFFGNAWVLRAAIGATLIVGLNLSLTLHAQKIEIEKPTIDTQKQLEEIVAKGIEFLKANQDDDGTFSKHFGPGITALAATAMMQNGVDPKSESIQKALGHLQTLVRKDGGIHIEQSLYRNYETCIAMRCFVEANTDGQYDDIIEGAVAFVKGLQWGPGTETDPSDPAYGGFGYGKHRRSDLSNTSFTIENLRKAGVPEDDESIQRAIIFVSRTQNLQSQHNNTPVAGKIGDKGFFYTPTDTPGLVDSENKDGSSQAGKTENGGLRSYGSMTYAGLKSLLYAGVDKDDIRVQGAFEWIQKHYTLDENPGMSFTGPKGGLDGLFYYYHTFGKALDAYGIDELRDSDGHLHDWRADLVTKMTEKQRTDGSWINESERWLENDSNLVTSYVLLALAHARVDEAKKQ